MSSSGNIRYIKLHNDGGYIAEMEVKYRKPDTTDDWDKEKWGGNVNKGHSKTIDPGTHDDETVASDGDEIKFRLLVKAGPDKTANETFIYDSTSTLQANYVSCGGVQSAELGYQGLTTHED